MSNSILYLLFMMVFLVALFVFSLFLWKKSPLKLNASLKEFTTNKKGILKLNECHYNVLGGFSECVEWRSAVNVTKLYNLLLEVKALKVEIEPTPYTISYFNLLDRLMALIVEVGYRPNEDQFIYLISLYQIMGNYIPLINQSHPQFSYSSRS